MPERAKKPEISEPIIHVMPEEFRGGKTPMTPVVSEKVPNTLPVPPKVVAPPVAPKPPAVLPKKKKLVSKGVLIAGVVVLLFIGGGALYLLSSIEPEKVEVVVVPEEVIPVEEKPECTDNDPCSGDLICVEEKCVVAPIEEPTEPVAGTDSDSDGLTDIEEVLFGSDPRNPDTDRDSYLDGNEVFHLYNPRADAPALLTDTGFARKVETEELSYSMVYPSRWTTKIDKIKDYFELHVPTSELFTVIKQAKDPLFPLSEWYLAMHPEASEEAYELMTTKEGYSGILAADKFTAYVEAGNDVFILSYSLEESTSINFLTSFQMMINSFSLKLIP